MGVRCLFGRAERGVESAGSSGGGRKAWMRARQKKERRAGRPRRAARTRTREVKQTAIRSRARASLCEGAPLRHR